VIYENDEKYRGIGFTTLLVEDNHTLGEIITEIISQKIAEGNKTDKQVIAEFAEHFSLARERVSAQTSLSGKVNCLPGFLSTTGLISDKAMNALLIARESARIAQTIEPDRSEKNVSNLCKKIDAILQNDKTFDSGIFARKTELPFASREHELLRHSRNLVEIICAGIRANPDLANDSSVKKAIDAAERIAIKGFSIANKEFARCKCEEGRIYGISKVFVEKIDSFAENFSKNHRHSAAKADLNNLLATLKNGAREVASLFAKSAQGEFLGFIDKPLVSEQAPSKELVRF